MARRRRPRRSGALAELPPAKLLGQIALLQLLLYAMVAPLMLFAALVSGRPFSLDLVFGWRPFRADTTQGWVVAFVWVLAAGLGGALAVVLVVGRSKLVLDFALTLHVLHLVVVVVCGGGGGDGGSGSGSGSGSSDGSGGGSGGGTDTGTGTGTGGVTLPTHGAWWAAMAVSAAVAVTVGTWGCRQRELRPISFGGGSPAATTATTTTTPTTTTTTTTTPEPDEEQGFVRGGRGRARDRGAYEMVPMGEGRQD